MKELAATLLGIVLSVVTAFAGVDFTVSGVVPQDTRNIVVYDLCRNMAIGSVVICEGTFLVKGTVENETVLAFIDHDHFIQSYVIVDAPSLSVDMRTDVMQGSPLNLKFSKVVQGLSKIQKVYMDNHRAALTTSNSDSVDIYTARALEARKREMAYYRTVFEANKDNTIGAFALYQLRKTLTYDDMKSIFSKPSLCLSHALVKDIRSRYESLKLRHPGMKVPDMTAYSVDGAAHSLSEYVGKGNYVLIDFWASWCGPCMVEMPNVKSNYEKYRDRGFMVVGLSFDNREDAWKKAIVEKGLDWVHLSDLKGWAAKAATVFGVKTIPSSILVDGTGKIVAVDLRGHELTDKLKEVYGE